MNVGIIKLWFSLPGKRSELSQTTGWTREIYDFCDALKRLKHTPYIISDVDGQCVYKEWDKEALDIVFVFCSKNSLAKDDSKEKAAKFQLNVNSYLDFCDNIGIHGTKIVYVVVDLQLIDKRFVNMANKTISQGDFGEYLPIEQLPLNWKKTHNKSKKHCVIYLGNQRDENRTLKLLDYYYKYNGNLDIYGKWTDSRITKLPSFRGPVDFKDSQKTLSRYMYSLMITDEIYERNNFVTPRYYEAVCAGAIPLCDHEFDRAGRIAFKFSAATLPPKDFYKKQFKKFSKHIYQTYSFDTKLKALLEGFK